ncbi:O-succinylbenzoate-CoA ligase [Melioribacter roseus P3M-2]|uniref:O-succinylbenzoate-CoA ligase n=1 Tax=Melioribacter roseus (strain DSM 23840 / JCM 17771 / VKM B-2668 / P3M-2) TaxID=1191523 RepID=I6YVS1_MELRP|nr:class I adenylate-forming enzyme family protein [Melioribacter roseus]AFN74682.1 O-succinylbenzoate-CoA ligase [Melioribacter roseus P3M-2]
MIGNDNHWLLSAVQNSPDSAAVEYDGHYYTYAEIYETVANIARSLKTLDIKEGSKAAVLAKNQLNFFLLVNAIWISGAVVIPINYRLTENESAELLKNIKPDILIYDSNPVGLDKDIPSVEAEFLFQNNPDKEYTAARFDSSRHAVIILTSGSGGKPKGIVHTFDTIYNSVFSFSEFFNPSEQSRWLASLPLYHIGGFMILCRALLLRHQIKLLPDPTFDRIKKILQEETFDFLSLVPTQLKTLLDENFNPVAKTVFLGGAPAEAGLVNRATELGWNIVKVYGSTETCSMVTALEVYKRRDKINSSGKPMPGCQIAVMQNDKFLPAGECGEIYVKSPSNFVGIFHPERIYRSEEYFRTGDIGFFDNEGFLYVEGRRDDIIITGGVNVSSGEVLKALTKLEYISDAYVFAERDEKWGSRISAAVVVKKDYDIAGTKIKNDLKSLLASYKIPKKLYFLSEIPRNEMGKINLEKLSKLLNQV